MGGKLHALRFHGKCEHLETIITTSNEIERALCPNCGHFGFRFLEEREGELERAQFARTADPEEESPL